MTECDVDGDSGTDVGTVINGAFNPQRDRAISDAVLGMRD